MLVNRMILDVFKYLFAQFEKQNIDYLLSGSYALNTYTTPRMTRDIDILIALNRVNLRIFLNIFPQEDFYYNEEGIKDDLMHGRMFNIIHQETAFKFDFIPKDRSTYAQSQFERKRFEKIDEIGVEAWVISPEDLFISKLRWIQQTQSDFHIRDLNNLKASQNLDMRYIKKWCAELNLKTFDLLP